MRAASREKNQTPECPSGALTYVRQFVSGNCEIHGSGGSDFARRSRKKNGVIPTHADPSNDSTRSGRGTCLCTTSTGYRQCKNVRSHQLCNITTRRNGSGIVSDGFMDSCADSDHHSAVLFRRHAHPNISSKQIATTRPASSMTGHRFGDREALVHSPGIETNPVPLPAFTTSELQVGPTPFTSGSASATM